MNIIRHPSRHVVPPRRPDGGFTLIEVLVAIVILSFGMLGVAGLMVTGIQFTHSAQQRTLATQLAYDMIDRMRSNQAAWSVNGGNADAGINYHRPASDVNAVGNPYLLSKPACVSYLASGAGCSTTDMADQDAYEWQQAIKVRLGNGVGIVCRDSSNSKGSYNGSTITHACNGVGPKYAIKIYWKDDRSSESTASEYQSFMTTFVP